MIVVHAAPNNHPGGVQGALLRCKYHSEIGPFCINQLPRAKAPKLIIRNIRNRIIFFIIPSLGFAKPRLKDRIS